MRNGAETKGISRPMESRTIPEVPTDPDRDWIAKIKETMSVDVARFVHEGLPPRMIVDRLFEIPEVEQAFRLRANRRRPLIPFPTTDVEKREIVDALNRVADWFDDGLHNDLVDELRVVAGDLHPDR